MPQHVLDALAAVPVEEITVLGRRGPAQAAFTTQELRELDGLDERDGAGRRRRPRARPRQRGAGGRRPERRPATWPCCAAGPTTRPSPAGPGCTCASSGRPVRLLGEDRVTGVEVERTAVDGDGRAMGTGELEVAAGRPRRPLGRLPRDCRCPACRWTSAPAPCRNEAGRVLRDGRMLAVGEYVAGWIKRGPSGVVGTNKHDARETVAALLADAADGTLRHAAARSATWSRSSSPAAPSRCCSTTGGRSTPPRSPWARPGAGRGRRCTSGRRCSPPSAPPPPAELSRARPAGRGRPRHRTRRRTGGASACPAPAAPAPRRA